MAVNRCAANTLWTRYNHPNENVLELPRYSLDLELTAISSLARSRSSRRKILPAALLQSPKIVIMHVALLFGIHEPFGYRINHCNSCSCGRILTSVQNGLRWYGTDLRASICDLRLLIPSKPERIWRIRVVLLHCSIAQGWCVQRTPWAM
jgi:hypothetical protein